MMDVASVLLDVGILAGLANLSLAAYLVWKRDAHLTALAMFFALVGLLNLAEHLAVLDSLPWWRLLYPAAAPATAYIYLVFRAEDASRAGGFAFVRTAMKGRDGIAMWAALAFVLALAVASFLVSCGWGGVGCPERGWFESGAPYVVSFAYLGIAKTLADYGAGGPSDWMAFFLAASFASFSTYALALGAFAVTVAAPLRGAFVLFIVYVLAWLPLSGMGVRILWRSSRDLGLWLSWLRIILLLPILLAVYAAGWLSGDILLGNMNGAARVVLASWHLAVPIGIAMSFLLPHENEGGLDRTIPAPGEAS